jgi:hypothetical protein
LSHPGKHLNGLLRSAADNSCRLTILIASNNGKTRAPHEGCQRLKVVVVRENKKMNLSY